MIDNNDKEFSHIDCHHSIVSQNFSICIYKIIVIGKSRNNSKISEVTTYMISSK